MEEPVGPVDILKFCLFKNGYRFKGRLSRRTFWIFVCLMACITLIYQLVVALCVSGMFHRESYTAFVLTSSVFGLIYFVFATVPLLSAAVRRLNDAGRSGFFLIIPWLVTLVCDFLFYGRLGLYFIIQGPLIDIAEMAGRLTAALTLGDILIGLSYLYLIYLWCLPSAAPELTAEGDGKGA